MRQEMISSTTRAPIERAPQPGSNVLLQASFGQEQVWLLHQLLPFAGLDALSRAVRLRGRVDREILQTSLQQVVLRHESLRTTFEVVDGIPWQKIAAEAY